MSSRGPTKEKSPVRRTGLICRKRKRAYFSRRTGGTGTACGGCTGSTCGTGIACGGTGAGRDAAPACIAGGDGLEEELAFLGVDLLRLHRHAGRIDRSAILADEDGCREVAILLVFRLESGNRVAHDFAELLGSLDFVVEVRVVLAVDEA